MKRQILSILILGCIILSGCVIQYNQSHPVYFEDNNDSVLNYQKCDALQKDTCDSSKKCKSYVINKLECANGLCYCD